MNVTLATLILISIFVNNLEADEFKLALLHTSVSSGMCRTKTHCMGGFKRVGRIVKDARESAKTGKGPNVIYLNAGDTFTESPLFHHLMWSSATEFMNDLHPDAISLGNHNFDKGIEGLISFINSTNFPILAANLNISNETALQGIKIYKSVVLDVGGRKVGIIGYLNKEATFSSPLKNILLKDEVESVKEESNDLHQKGVDIIIALGPSEYELDEKVARDVPLVDVVVGGQAPSDNYLKVIEKVNGKRVPVIRTPTFTKDLGHLSISFDNNGDATHFFEERIDIIPNENRNIISTNDEIIGTTSVILEGHTCCEMECNFGNFITDAFISYFALGYSGEYWTDAPIAIIKSDYIQYGVDVLSSGGIITKTDLHRALPQRNLLHFVTVTGTDLLKILELAASDSSEFVQVSGIHAVYDMSKPCGSRVISAKARCSECTVPKYDLIEDHRKYNIVMNADTLKSIDIASNINKNIENITDFDVVATVLKAKSPIYPEVQGRIVVYGVSHNYHHWHRLNHKYRHFHRHHHNGVYRHDHDHHNHKHHKIDKHDDW